ncbi:ABC transporter substrate-binding protein [Gordonia sp. CPCC 206044]|uniref:ABC transporter substrate-binding protein n=1 Tax=Gordonia sp. CPCC 206044 TaxID=3140793 RepID=UPI003AF33D69
MNPNRFTVRPLLLAASAALITLVAACSAPAEDDPESSAAHTPVTVEHEYGATTIDHEPTRVVTFSTNWTDTLAALDIPITAEFVQKGYSGPNNHFEWTPDHESQIKVVDSLTSIDVAELAAFKPDLILAGYVGDQKNYDRLSALAPTIPVMRKGASVDTWEDITTTTGKIFGKESDAAELVTATQDKIDAFKADHPAAVGKTFTFAQFQQTGGVGAVNSTEDAAAGLLTQLGFVLNPKLAAENKGGATRSMISSERIDLLDSDLLVAWTLGDKSVYAKVPGWDSLTAVRDDTVVYLTNDNAPAFGVPSAPSVEYVIGLLDPVADEFA